MVGNIGQIGYCGLHGQHGCPCQAQSQQFYQYYSDLVNRAAAFANVQEAITEKKPNKLLLLLR